MSGKPFGSPGPNRPSLQTASQGQFSDPKRARRLRDISSDAPSKLALFRRVYEGHASPREIIKAFCLQCMWMNEEDIRTCQATDCPHWNVRPYQRPRVTQ